MPNIKPISDLRNYSAVLEDVTVGSPVYLTKNGYGSMVVMSLEKYAKLMSNKEYEDYIENELDEADREAEDPNTKYYSHDEFKKMARRILDGEE